MVRDSEKSPVEIGNTARIQDPQVLYFILLTLPFQERETTKSVSHEHVAVLGALGGCEMPHGL